MIGRSCSCPSVARIRSLYSPPGTPSGSSRSLCATPLLSARFLVITAAPLGLISSTVTPLLRPAPLSVLASSSQL